jgi:hypothetical protein
MVRFGSGVKTALTLKGRHRCLSRRTSIQNTTHSLASNLGGVRSSDDCFDRRIHCRDQSFQFRDRFNTGRKGGGPQEVRACTDYLGAQEAGGNAFGHAEAV